ncbi:MAG: hypothetical protein ACFB0B_08120 [Thermonemataceae bacterium]
MFTLQQLINQKERFIKVISRYCPLSEDLLTQYTNVWDWEQISQNEQIPWTAAILERFQNKLHWREGLVLNTNPAIPLTPELIKTFIKKKKWQWDDLMWNPQVFQEADLLALCLPHWNRGARQYLKNSLSSDTDLGTYKYFQFTSWGEDAHEWAPIVVEQAKGLHWDLFSGVQGFPWTAEFIEKHQDQLNWKRLSWNAGLPWSISFIQKFEDRWDWRWMSWQLPWSIELIQAFEDRWHWRRLTNEDKIPFLKELADTFPEKVMWADAEMDHGAWTGMFDGLINNEQIDWTVDYYQQMYTYVENFFHQLEQTPYLDWGGNEDWIRWSEDDEEKFYWTYYAKGNNWSPDFFDLMLQKQAKENVQTIDWENICRYAKHLWHHDFIAQYQNKLQENLYALCGNPYFPWHTYWDYFNSQLNQSYFRALSSNTGLQLSIQLVEANKEDWDWVSLSSNSHITEELIVYFQEDWDWRALSMNKAISYKILQKYPERVSWYHLSRREALAIEQLDLDLPWHWERIFQTHTNPSMIQKYLPTDLLEDFLEAM